jgi:hypothetical protein
MKTKKKTFMVLLLSLLVSLFLLCFGTRDLYKAYAEEIPNTETTVVPENTNDATEPTTEVESWNNKIKAWLGTFIGSAGIALDSLLVILISKKNKQSVAVTVNDSHTQEKLDSLQVEYSSLKKLLVDLFQLNKGTLDVLLTLYSDNKSIDENMRSIIKSISINSEDVLKDVSDIINADTHKAAKTALQNISNIVLG